jgi:23S rRNA pseudouridine1911/1915/1917 synthase
MRQEPPGQPADTGAAHDVIVPAELAGQRLDRALAALVPGLSRSQAQSAIAAGRVRVAGRPARASLLVESGARISLAPAAMAPTPVAESVARATTPALRVIYEDEHLLVVDKPAGQVVHPAPGHPSGTLVDALLAYVPQLDTSENPTRPGIVHRLDKDTSGLLVVAKDARSHAELARQMKARAVVKRYLALIEGELPAQEGVIEAPIGRDPRQRKRMALVSEASGGREARTRFRVLSVARGRSLVELQLETGRTHQIRVHLAALHHPVVGDPTYGRAQPPLPARQFLHAAHLEFAHPITGAWMVFDAPLPEDLATFLAEWER